MLTHRAAPMLIRWILALQDLEFNDPGGGAQAHRASAPVHEAPTAEGGNLAVTLGFFLRPLLQSLAGPLAAFGFHFQFNFAQGGAGL